MPRNPDPVWIDPDVEDSLMSETMQRREYFARKRGMLTPDMAEKANRLLYANSNLSLGLMQALAQSDVPDETAQQLIDEDEGNWFDQVRDGVGDVLGDVVSATATSADWALTNTYEQAIKPAVRGAFTIADGLAQEIVQRPLTAGLAAARGEGGFHENYHKYGDSALKNLIQGDLADVPEGQEDPGVLGRGLFPGGRAEMEAESERTLTIRGQRADVGRAISNATVGHFATPGDRAYDMTAGVTGFAVDVGLDPLAWMTAGGSAVVRSSRALKAGDAADSLRAANATDVLAKPAVGDLVEAVGGVRGARRDTVLVEHARNFFGNDKLLDRLAKADTYDIFQSWGNSPANRIDMETINRLGRAGTQADVAEILFSAVAHGDITRKGVMTGPGHFTRTIAQRTPGLRIFTAEGKLAGVAPSGKVSADDIGDAAQKVDSLLRQGNVPREARAAIFDRMSGIAPGQFDALFDVTTDALDEIAKRVGDEGDKLTSLKGVAKQWADELEAFREYSVDSLGNPINVPFAKTKQVQNFDGEVIETLIPTPQMTSELNSLALHLPDVTDIRRAATKNTAMRKLYTSKGWDITADATRWATNAVFKPAVLLRPAYVLRIGLEEQARLIAGHHDSIFTHPARYLMANVVNRKAMKDLVGEDLKSTAQALDVITKDAHGVMADATKSRSRVYGTTSVSVDESTGMLKDTAFRGWRGELGQLSSAREGRKMAELRGNLDEFKAWARGEGRSEIERLSRINDDAASLLDFGDDFDEWARGLSKRVEAKTGGWDDEIIDRIVSQNIPFAGAGKATDDANMGFNQFLSRKVREGRNPAKVKVEHLPENHHKHLDSILNTAFDWITGKPTSYLARYPAFRSTMIKRGAEMMDGLADDALRSEVVEAFTKNLNLSGKEARQLRKAAEKATGRQGVVDNVEDFNQFLVTKSAQDVKDLLFDITKRGAAQDAAVAIVPFLDAWKEVTKTWMRTVKENPSFFIRAQAGYRELQDQGVFYANSMGEEVFRYPGGGALSTFAEEMSQRGGGLTDAPMAALATAGRVATGDTPDATVAMEGRVQGLNLVAQGVGPGFGPVVQWAASSVKSPEAEGFRDFVVPFGTGAIENPEDLLNPAKLAESLAIPAWARKTLNAVSEGGVDERQWNSMVGDSRAALAASGDYNLNDPDDQDRLLEDAERYAHYLLLMRGFTQFAGPTGPTATHEVELDDVDTAHPDWDPENDPTARSFFLDVMRGDYHRLVEAYGHDVAASKFYDMYGTEPFFVVQAKSTTHGRELPVSEEGGRWMVRNKDVVEDYDLVAGYFAPTDEDAEFDFSTYAQQVLAGQRESLTPEDQQRLAAKARARAIWQTVKDRTENLPPKQRDMARQQAKIQLEQVHPGWERDVLAMPRAEDKIKELQRAMLDPRLKDEPLTKPLKQYFIMRETALMAIRNATGSPTATLNREDALQQRRMLTQFGTVLAQKHPSFLGVWSSLLKNELEEDS